LLDVQQITIIADYFVICSASSERQLQALTEGLSRQLKAEVGKPMAVEGLPESGWMLADYGDVVVHLFLPQARAFYALEELWKEAQTIVHIQ
jgi:ribosome-associated protein